MAPLGETTRSIQELLDRLNTGDKQAAKLIIAISYDRLRKLAHQIVDGNQKGFDATSVLHEAYVKLLDALLAVKPQTPAAFFALVGKKIRFMLIDLIRHSQGRGQNRPTIQSLDKGKDSSSDKSHFSFDPVGPGMNQELSLDILQAIDELDPDEEEVVNLRYIHGYTIAETAEILGVSVDTVKRRSKSATDTFSILLASYDESNHPQD